MYNAYMTAEKIYIVDSRADNVFVNQAVEAALTDYVGKGSVALMLWANPDTVVIGRNQDAYAECRVDLLESNGGTLARRLSGGGAVFHNVCDLNFTFVADEQLFSKDDDFDVVTAALAKFGIKAERSGRNDLTVDGAKFSGNAYRYVNGKKLHHGTLIIKSSPEEVARYLTPPSDKFAGKSVKSVQSAVVALSSLNPEITRDSLTVALKESFVEKYKDADVIFLPPTALGADAVINYVAFFAVDDWRYGKKTEFSVRFADTVLGRNAVVNAAFEGDALKEVRIDTDSLAPESVLTVEKLITKPTADIPERETAEEGVYCDTVRLEADRLRARITEEKNAV